MTNHAPARLGILMLDTAFPRIVGDVGNAQTWPFAVRFGVVKGATPQAIVCEDVEPFVQAFIEEGHRLIAKGCIGLATTCGFLSLIRPCLVQALGVPVAASALEQAGQVGALLGGGQRIGILTISQATLTPAHLAAAGVPLDSPVEGVDGSSFARSILENRPELDENAARAEMVAGAKEMLRKAPDVGAIILECTNMVPYADEIARQTNRPVFSIYTYLRWFHESLAPRHFPQN